MRTIRELKKSEGQFRRHNQIFIYSLKKNNLIRKALDEIQDEKLKNKYLRECVNAGMLAATYDFKFIKNAWIIKALNNSERIGKDGFLSSLLYRKEIIDKLSPLMKRYIIHGLVWGVNKKLKDDCVRLGFFLRVRNLRKNELDIIEEEGLSFRNIIRYYNNEKNEIKYNSFKPLKYLYTSERVFEIFNAVWKESVFEVENVGDRLVNRIKKGSPITKDDMLSIKGISNDSFEDLGFEDLGFEELFKDDE